jgi:hypothetical protein
LPKRGRAEAFLEAELMNGLGAEGTIEKKGGLHPVVNR